MEAVISSIADTGGIRVFELRAVGGAALPRYEAGAHLDVTLGNGLVRQYSLCCREPSAASYRGAAPPGAAEAPFVLRLARCGTEYPGTAGQQLLPAVRVARAHACPAHRLVARLVS